jgi:hypothetical protein
MVKADGAGAETPPVLSRKAGSVKAALARFRTSLVGRLLAIALLWASVAAAANLDDRLLSDALALLPPQWSFPFDSGHLVVIEDYGEFIKAHAELGARSDLQEQGKQLYAFTISQSWPIYFNFDGHHSLTEAYARPEAHWVAYFIAAVLVHEAVHARGDARESIALLEELMLDRGFKRIGKLPALVDTDKLAEHYLNAVEEERGRTSGSSEPVRRAKR